jgi:hypothetical protein
MIRARISVDFNDRAELDPLTLEARMLYIEGLVQANKLGSDGAIRARALRRFSRLDDPESAAAELVDAGIWQVADDGWQIPNWKSEPDSQIPSQETAALKARHLEQKARQSGEYYRILNNRNASKAARP